MSGQKQCSAFVLYYFYFFIFLFFFIANENTLFDVKCCFARPGNSSKMLHRDFPVKHEAKQKNNNASFNVIRKQGIAFYEEILIESNIVISRLE